MHFFWHMTSRKRLCRHITGILSHTCELKSWVERTCDIHITGILSHTISHIASLIHVSFSPHIRLFWYTSRGGLCRHITGILSRKNPSFMYLFSRWYVSFHDDTSLLAYFLREMIAVFHWYPLTWITFVYRSLFHTWIFFDPFLDCVRHITGILSHTNLPFIYLFLQYFIFFDSFPERDCANILRLV